MKKDIYSLLLGREIVELIDDLASKTNTSRSNYINEILADHLSYTTFGQIAKDILSQAKDQLESIGGYVFVPMNSAHFMDIRAELNYKYRPAIRYCVEVYRSKNHYSSRIKANIRTQNRELTKSMEDFFSLWKEVEKKRHIKNSNVVSNESLNNNEKGFIRILEDKSNKQVLGLETANYINVLHRSLYAFFENKEDYLKAKKEIERIYGETY